MKTPKEVLHSWYPKGEIIKWEQNVIRAMEEYAKQSTLNGSVDVIKTEEIPIEEMLKLSDKRLCPQEEWDSIRIELRSDLKKKVKHLIYSYIPEDRLFLTQDDVISVLAEIIVDETKINKI